MLPTIATGNVGSALAGEYEVANSLRFNQGSSDYLNRTNGSSTGKIWSFSCWFKISDPTDTNMNIFNVSSDANNTTYVEVATKSQNGLDIQVRNGEGTTYIRRRSSAVLRDVSAWYNVIVIFDSTNSTADDRIKIFLNGSRITSFAENTGTVDADYVTQIGVSGATVEIGRNTSAAHHFDGYLAEMVLVDGTALSTTDIGEYDSDTNIWKPIDVSGLTFGTNGFYLDFENSGSLGADVSGNGNNFTVNNLTSVDQSTDTCTNNYCTMNPLSAGVGDTSRIPTFSEGNLKFTAPSATFSQAISTFGVDQGKWYYEVKVVSSTNLDKLRVGLWNIDKNVSSGEIQDVSSADSGVFYMNKDGGEMRLNATPTTNDYGTFVQNDIIGVANDIDNRTISIYKNGSVIVNAYSYSSGIASGIVLTPAFMGHTDTSFEINFGSPSYSISSGNSDANGYGNFEYSVPSGYYALNTKNLAEFG